MMELLKCAQCGDRPGLLVTVADRAAGTSLQYTEIGHDVIRRLVGRYKVRNGAYFPILAQLVDKFKEITKMYRVREGRPYERREEGRT